MISSKTAKTMQQQNTEERLFKVLEGIDWKLWEIMNMMKDNLPATTDTEKLKK
jgi:hypothetical protein